MRFGLVALKNVCDVNGFEEASELRLTAGNPGQIYFRLVDLDRLQSAGSLNQLRYVPAAGATMSMTINALDSNNVVNRAMTNPFSADDRSVWLLSVLATDKLAFGSMEATLTMGGNQYNVPVVTSIVADPSGTGKFFC